MYILGTDTIQSITLTLRFITIAGMIMRAFSLEDVLTKMEYCM